MVSGNTIRRAVERGCLSALLALALCASASGQRLPARAQGAVPRLPTTFRQVAPQGFGDRYNSKAWSMIWWKDHLYVGTARAHMCVEYWALADTVGWPFTYPPDDPDVECTESPQDLPLQAEIWRYTPETATWDRVFQSPNDVQIPDHPDKYTSRDAGFRGITAFTDPDGTEALYIGGVTSEAMNPGVPPPRILRSVDGEHWDPVPQDPGTVLGDLGRGQANFRGMEVYEGRLYVINGGLRGGGSILEAANPAGGNDNFRWITPDDVRVYEIAPYNGYLYAGTQATLDDPNSGYRVMRTDATGTPPYDFEVVVDKGAYLTPLPSNGVVSMYEYQGLLYVGTDKPAELIRIYPDDTWELVVGAPRDTPDGRKEPLSGMGTGFDWLLNEHIWRMAEHRGRLYVGTNDMTAFGKEYRWAEPLLEAMGFDLFVSEDGAKYSLLTRTGGADEGFGDRLDVGTRVFASTPYGLFAGTANHFYGLNIYLGEAGYCLYLPLVRGAGGGSVPLRALAIPAGRPDPPAHVGLENVGGDAVLAWDPVPGALRYRVLRSAFVPAKALGIEGAEPDLMVPQPFEEVGRANGPFFVDATVHADRVYHYQVLAEGANGLLSSPSNLARSPSLNSPVTLSDLRQAVAKWTGGGDAAVELKAGRALAEAQGRLDAGDLEGARARLEVLRAQVTRGQVPEVAPWRTADLARLLGRLAHRVRLAEVGIVSPAELR